MITAVSIRNFKSFGDERQDIPLAPLTLVYGPNSAGKSSVIQSLLVLKQTIRDTRQRNGQELITRGDTVNLGTYRNVVHKHSERRVVELGITTDQDRTLPIKAAKSGTQLVRNGEQGLPIPFDESSYVLRFAGEESESTGEIVGRFHEARLGIGDEVIGFRPKHGVHGIDLGSGGNFDLVPGHRRRLARSIIATYSVFQVTFSQSEFGAQAPTKVSMSTVLSFLDDIEMRVREDDGTTPGIDAPSSSLFMGHGNGFVPRPNIRARLRGKKPVASDKSVSARDMLLYLSFVTVASEPSSSFLTALRSVAHIGPFRDQPSRVFDVPSQIPTDVGPRGEYAAAILATNDRALRTANKWFKSMKVPYKIDPHRVTFDVDKDELPIVGQHVAMVLRDRRTGVSVGAQDVGFGVSQVMPVLTQLAVRGGQTICIEQPEIHLHPRLQAGLVDVFIESAGLAPNIRRNDDLHNQVIVETHSEALILRLQRRIREGRCDASKVRVIYVDQIGRRGSSAVNLRLSNDGNFLDPWPGGFFEDALDDLLG